MDKTGFEININRPNSKTAKAEKEEAQDHIVSKIENAEARKRSILAETAEKLRNGHRIRFTKEMDDLGISIQIRQMVHEAEERLRIARLLGFGGGSSDKSPLERSLDD